VATGLDGRAPLEPRAGLEGAELRMRQRRSRWSRRRHEVKEGHVVACGTDRAVSGSHAKVLLALNKICSCRLYIETILPLSTCGFSHSQSSPLGPTRPYLQIFIFFAPLPSASCHFLTSIQAFLRPIISSDHPLLPTTAFNVDRPPPYSS
jgi:hypothetical protein